ncbi:MAG: TetR/AcrR family transcriptional regulator [Acidimicrobiales bacterium]
MIECLTMSGKTNSDRKTLRRQATIAEIVTAAWDLSREKGLGNFSMRELGDAVGMRAQSLYSYFESKNEIFDAMFADGNRAFVIALDEPPREPSSGADPVEVVSELARRFFHFCTSEPVRYQLLFQRTLPDFEPSPESYAIAEQGYRVAVAPLVELGFEEDELDIATAIMAGLVAQQLSNDPTGDRWERLIERATQMLLAEVRTDSPTTSRQGS